MTSQKLNQAIAKAVGAPCCQCANPSPYSVSTRCLFCREPHARLYTSDLNAIHKLESTLTDEQWCDYYTELHKAAKTYAPPSATIDPYTRNFIHAPARMKAECILKALTV